MEHTLNWFEIPVADLTRAILFYETLTGRSLRRESFGGPEEAMAVFQASGPDAVNGALVRGPDAVPSGAGSTVYLNAGPRIGDWLARVEAAGGRVATPRTALPPGMGYFAHIIDTEGNRIGLHAMD
jgi:uncharacterized protein